MATVRIPHSSEFPRDKTYAQLIRRAWPRGPVPFDGRFLRTGSRIEESELRPTPDWPAVPLLVEYAGNDHSGRGHNRSRDIHVLWTFQAGDWIELTRVTSQGPEWRAHLMPIIIRELRAVPINFVQVAREASGRVMLTLGQELNGLEDEGQQRLISFLYDSFTALVVDQAA